MSSSFEEKMWGAVYIAVQASMWRSQNRMQPPPPPFHSWKPVIVTNDFSFFFFFFFFFAGSSLFHQKRLHHEFIWTIFTVNAPMSQEGIIFVCSACYLYICDANPTPHTFPPPSLWSQMHMWTHFCYWAPWIPSIPPSLQHTQTITQHC